MTANQKNELITILKNSFLFKGIEESKVKEFASQEEIVIKTFAKGERAENIDSPGLSFVGEGTLEVFGQTEGKTVLLNTLKEGCAFGVARLFCKEDSEVSKIISKGTSKVYFIPFNIVEELIITEGKVAVNYISFLSEKIRFLNRRIGEYTAKNSESRLAMYLLSNNPDEKGEVVIKMPLSRLAEHLGMGRASLYRSIEELERDGYIKRGERGKFTILDLEGLEQYIERND